MKRVLFFLICILGNAYVVANEYIEFGEGSYSYEEALYQEALYRFEEEQYIRECYFSGPLVPVVPRDICKAFFKTINPNDAYLLYERINSLRKVFGEFRKGSFISTFEDDGRIQKSSFVNTYFKGHSGHHILFINGIKTTFASFLKHLDYIHELDPRSTLHGVYNSTKNFEKDIFETHLGLCDIQTPPVQILKEALLALFREKSVQKLTIICHSQGAIHTYNALKTLPMEIKSWVKVVAVAPAKFITRDEAWNSINALTSDDFVPSLQYLYGYTKKNAYIVDLVSKKDSEGLHSFQSTTYKEFLLANIR